MFVLTKLFEKEEFRKEFIEGNLYLSSMSEFTKVIPERGLMEAVNNGDMYAAELLEKQHNYDQKDAFEGTVASIPVDKINLIPEYMRKYIITDVRARAVGYDYSNLCCFCKMDYERIGRCSLDWEERDLRGFGNLGIIITDQKEFLMRIRAAAQKYGYKFLCGSVSYHPLMYGKKKVISANMIHIRIEEEICIDDMPKVRKYDAFDKCVMYKNQNEWRLVINKGYKEDHFLRFDVGDLSDIVVPVEKDNLRDCMERLFISGRIKPPEEHFYGNIRKAEMRDEFYRMGDSKAFLMPSVGKVVYET